MPLGLRRFAAEPTPTPSQRPASSSAASVRSSPASARSASSATPASAGRPGAAQQRSERHPGLDAAAVAARAQLAGGIDGDVAELAAEPARAAEQRAVDDDARPDAQLARDVEEVAEAAPGALPQLGERAEVRLVLGADRERRPAEARAQQLGHVDVAPAEIGRDEQAAVAVDEAGQRDHRAGRQQPLLPAARRARRRPGRRGRRAPRRATGRGCRGARAPGGARCPSRSAARTARKSTPTSSPSPTTRRPLSSTGSAGRPTVPRSSTSVSRTSPNSISSPTRLETVVLFSPVSCAIAARERGPRSAT